MIHMLRYVFFALILYKSVQAYVGIIPASQKPDKFDGQEGCYYSAYDRLLQVDVPFAPVDEDRKNCEKYTCKASGEIYLEGCSKKGVSGNCESVAPDYTKAFPDCCGKVRCTLPDGKVVEV